MMRYICHWIRELMSAQTQPAIPISHPRRGYDFSKRLAEKGWFHSVELPDGTKIEGHNSLESLRERYSRFPLPPVLTGTRLLDIGAWDGWFSFEAERRGADVTAVDCVEVENFRHLHRQFASKIDYRILDVLEVPAANLGKFDFVLFLGVLYHLRHPLLALEIVCSLTEETAIVESFVTDASNLRCGETEVPTLEFYETDELGNQLDNWYGPSLGCLMAMCRAAGFARVELIYASGTHAAIACHRKWEPIVYPPAEDPPELLGVANARNFGINFSSQKDEYLSCWFRSPLRTLDRQKLRLEIGGYGVRALYASDQGAGIWLANFRLPPGLEKGWNRVRLRFDRSLFGSEFRIVVDTPLFVDKLLIDVACDGRTWNRQQISLCVGGCVSCWVRGLPENADRNNVSVFLGEVRLKSDYVSLPDGSGSRQINAIVPSGFPPGDYSCRVECANVSSDIWLLTARTESVAEVA
jgi:tRNA (mo5U34)-methyltransferase